MVFSGMTFLFAFLPVVLAGYWLLPPGRARQVWLLLASAVFYAWADVAALPLLAICTLWTYGFARAIAKARAKGKPRLLLWVAMALPAGGLVYYKYAGFLLKSLNALLGAGLAVPRPILPLGISFYTFSMIGYLVQVYRGKAAEKDLLRWCTGSWLFIKMTAGPIEEYHTLQESLNCRSSLSIGSAAEGIWRFCIGLGKKAVLSASLAQLMAEFSASSERSALYCWLYAAAVVGSIYYDFSGYSDMAVGLGRLFGLPIGENFAHPLGADSIRVFWRRWHMSLGAWFKNYLYIPLGGSKAGTLRLILSTAVVWLFTGLWHGADWGYALWGVYFGLLLLPERACGKAINKLPRVLRHGYVLLSVLVGFVVFGGTGFRDSMAVIAGMFTGGKAGLEGIYALKNYAVVLAVAAMCALPIGSRVGAALRNSKKGSGVYYILRPIAAMALLVLAVAWIVDGSFSPFFYAQF